MKKITFITMSLLVAMAFGQEKSKGDKAYDNYNYSKAITEYENDISEGKKSETIFKRLGNSYYFNAKLPEANKWYEQLMSLNAKVEAEYLYRYSQTLKSVKNYEEANKYLAKFKEANSDDSRAVLYNENPDYLDDIELQSGRYTIVAAPFNTKYSDFAPAVNGDKLVFSTSMNKSFFSKFIHEWNDKPFIDLYQVNLNDFYSTDNQPIKLKGKINTSFHESSAVFTADGSTAYFTRNSKKSEAGVDVNRLKIFKATKKNGKWKEVVELPFNDDDYIYAHPALSPDQTKLYFASNMPGTKGYSDLYMVDILDNGGYGVPKNLGPEINTEGRETFPFVSADNKLYFASDGHLGLGGLDIFVVKLDADGDVQGQVVNIGAPVNGPSDDFTYIVDETGKKGYFSSNRDGGVGGDDIYVFDETKPLLFKVDLIVNGTVKDSETGKVLPGGVVSVFDTANNLIKESAADANGVFSFELDGNKDHLIRANTKDYLISEKYVNKVEKSASAQIVIALDRDKVVSETGDDLSKILRLSTIYFDFDSSSIRLGESEGQLDKVIEVMNLYPQIKLEVRSHTDSRANDDYNLALSKRRAKATVDYIIGKGISPDRISGNGFGETKLINKCSNGISCSEKEHELNRRSEFIVIGQ